MDTEQLPPRAEDPHQMPTPNPRPPEIWDTDVDLQLVPARMINELAFCPRLFAFEWLHEEWAENGHTVEGRRVHRRVDQPGRRGLAADPDKSAGEGEEGTKTGEDGRNEENLKPQRVRSVRLSDPLLGLVAICDIVEEGPLGEVVPIDYKKGNAPDPKWVPEGAYEADQVQVCVQALLLRAHGYTCTDGAVWYAGSRRRVDFPITDALVAKTLGLRDEARRLAKSEGLPPPLIDSPKCGGCSLVGLCMPDETNLLLGRREGEVRPLVPARDDGVSIFMKVQGGSIGKNHEELVFREKGKEIERHRVRDTTQVVIFGNVSLSGQVLSLLAEHEVPLSIHSSGGWYLGSWEGNSQAGARLRIAQHEARSDHARRMHIARTWIQAKIKNQRTMLRRNGDKVPTTTLRELAEAQRAAEQAPDIATLLGIEGRAARVYFTAFPRMIRTDLRDHFEMDGRNRRPPKDPINALLSFAYACLVRECAHALRRVGFDLGAGYLHEPRAARPALALDLMEPFRPILADSAVLSAVNKKILEREDFLIHPTGVVLHEGGRTRFLKVIEERMNELGSHPVLGTRCSMRRMLEIESRLLSRHLLGEFPTLTAYTTR